MADTVRGFPKLFPVRTGDEVTVRYRIAHWAARIGLRLFGGRNLRIEGLAHVPRDGPLLVIANHLSNLDPLLFGGFFPRTLFAMAKVEMYRYPLAAWWLGGCNCFPVDRNSPDRRAVTRALQLLRANARLLVFIEGTRSRTATMQRAEPGAGFMARRSGAMVQPVAIWGTEGARRFPIPLIRPLRVTMRFGVPFMPALEGRRDDAVIADELASRIAALLPDRYRGVYGAGLPDDALSASRP